MSEQAQQMLIAFQRFGLGALPGGPKQIERDPKAAVLRELDVADIAEVTGKKLPSYERACLEGQQGYSRAEELRRRELDARIDKQMRVQIGFVERLVMFWQNHFSMTVNKAETIRGTIGQLERDVIRKNVLGRFEDMLDGVMSHPAMIAYLDNDDSMGPNSEIGLQWGAGFNENLARESLELHTLGSGGGYTEQDVSAYAKILTGWSYVRGWESDGRWNGGTPANRGRFIFREEWHEPGPIEFMGRTYAQPGTGQARRVFEFLAASPATAEHIAFKLVRHFITDEPTPAMVEPLKARFLETDGNLKQVARALVELPEAWTLPLEKVRTPYELAIAQYRALGTRYLTDEYWALSETLRALHHMIWEAPSPEGYSDEAAYWLDPDGMTIRLDTAQLSARVYGSRLKGSTPQLANNLYGKSLSRATRERIAGSGDVNRELTILFCSPEFQRR
jgi:uncharacterized protein (DUF1800 family)